MAAFTYELSERVVEDLTVTCSHCGWKGTVTHEDLVKAVEIWRMAQSYSKPTLHSEAKMLAAGWSRGHVDRCPKSGKCKHKDTDVDRMLSTGKIREFGHYDKPMTCLDCGFEFSQKDTNYRIKCWFWD